MFRWLTLTILVLMAVNANNVVGKEDNALLNKLMPSHSIEKAYDKVNEYLVSHCGDGIRINMDAVISWLEPKASGMSHGYKHALKQLAALRDLERNKKCNREGYKIVLENNQAIEKSKLLFEMEIPMTQPRKIDLIVMEYTKDHAKECLRTYRSEFSAKYKLIDKAEEIKRVEELANGYLNARGKGYLIGPRTFNWIACSKLQLKNEMDNLYSDQLHHLLALTHLNGLVLLEALKHLAKHDPKVIYLGLVDRPEYGKRHKTNLVVEKNEVRELFSRYILKPCQFYLQKLGPTVLEQASYDEQNLNYLKNNKQTVLAHKDFYLAIFNFQLCSKILDEQKYLLSDLEQVI